MRTFAILRLTTIVMGMAGALLPATAWTEEASAHCEGIATDLATAIKTDPSKALMLVEDALVINEGCASAIIRAAVAATEADADLTKQIVETGINVAPRMAVAIREAGGLEAAAVVAGTETTVPHPVMHDAVLTGQSDKIVAAVDAIPEEEEEEEVSSGFGSVGGSLRGVYFMQPPPSGMPSSDVLRKYANVSTSPCSCTP